MPFAPSTTVAAQFARVDARLRARSAATRRSWSARWPRRSCVGRDDAEVARRAATIGQERRRAATRSASAGTVAQVVDQLGTWREQTGITRFYLQLLDLADLDQLELIAAEVAPQLA